MEVSYTNLVRPKGEKLQSTKPFWSFSPFHIHMSFPKELCTYGDAVREVVWTLCFRALPPVAISNPPTRATGCGNCSVRARNLLQNFHQ
jgi:hypothetical protein